MTIIQVKYFVAVGDELNFTKAAEKMFVTQQVISKQIKILEEELGFPLLIRDKHKVAFTDGGRLMYQFWVEVLRQHRQVVEKAFDLMNKNDQIIRIGTIEVNRFYDWIVCAIDKVNSNDPSREFRVESVSSRSLYQGLIDTKYDLIISVANENMNLPERFEEIKFKKSNPKLVISSSHPAYRSDLLLMDLKEYPLYIYSSMFSMKAKKQILSHCHKIGFEPKKIEEFDAVESLEMALYSGNGYTLTFPEFVRNTVGKLELIPLKTSDIDAGFSIAYPRDKKKMLEPFIETLSEIANQ